MRAGRDPIAKGRTKAVLILALLFFRERIVCIKFRERVFRKLVAACTRFRSKANLDANSKVYFTELSLKDIDMVEIVLMRVLS